MKTLILLLPLLLLAACGQAGALYLPGQEPQRSVVKPAAPAPAQTDDKNKKAAPAAVP